MDELNLPKKLIPFESSNYPDLNEFELWMYSYAMIAVHDHPEFYQFDGKLWGIFDWTRFLNQPGTQGLINREIFRECKGHRLVFIGDIVIDTGRGVKLEEVVKNGILL